MSDNKKQRLVCVFNGINLFAECDDKQAVALARVFNRYAVRTDLDSEEVLKNAGLPLGPDVKQCQDKCHEVCTFNGVKLYADCDSKHGEALATFFNHCACKEDLKVATILEEAGLKPKPEVKQQEPGRNIIKDEDRPKFSDREADEKKRLEAARKKPEPKEAPKKEPEKPKDEPKPQPKPQEPKKDEAPKPAPLPVGGVVKAADVPVEPMPVPSPKK